VLVGLPEPSGDILGTIGVFLSGAGSILTALGAIHYERRRGEKMCRDRFEAFREGMRVGGVKMENDRSEHG
jgi:hypothetical protein